MLTNRLEESPSHFGSTGPDVPFVGDEFQGRFVAVIHGLGGIAEIIHRESQVAAMSFLRKLELIHVLVVQGFRRIGRLAFVLVAASLFVVICEPADWNADYYYPWKTRLPLCLASLVVKTSPVIVLCPPRRLVPCRCSGSVDSAGRRSQSPRSGRITHCPSVSPGG